MPIYTYKCEEGCGVFERIKTMDEAGKGEYCPQCGEMSRQILASTAPPRGGDTPKYHSPPRSEDGGFQKEWNELWKDPI